MGRGKVIIFAMPKFGSHFNDDVKRYHDTFQKFGASVSSVYLDLTRDELKNKMKEYQNRDFSNYSYVVVTISSKGDRGDNIETSDGKYVNLNTSIVLKLQKNVTLRNKPKLFIINMNRGSFGNSFAISGTSSSENNINFTNTMRFYATHEGGKIYKSIFSEVFCYYLYHEGHSKSLQHIMTETKKKVMKLTSDSQIPNLCTTMYHDVILGRL